MNYVDILGTRSDTTIAGPQVYIPGVKSLLSVKRTRPLFSQLISKKRPDGKGFTLESSHCDLGALDVRSYIPNIVWTRRDVWQAVFVRNLRYRVGWLSGLDYLQYQNRSLGKVQKSSTIGGSRTNKCRRYPHRSASRVCYASRVRDNRERVGCNPVPTTIERQLRRLVRKCFRSTAAFQALSQYIVGHCDQKQYWVWLTENTIYYKLKTAPRNIFFVKPFCTPCKYVQQITDIHCTI